MSVIWWIIIGFVVYFFISGWWEKLREAVCPFQYKSISLTDLGTHANELVCRGWHDSQMIIVAEGTTKAVCLRKEINQPGQVRLHLVVTEDVTHDVDSRRFELKEILEYKKIPFFFGLGGFRSNPYGMVVECGSSVDTVNLAMTSIFLEFFGLNENATYRLWVKGTIDWRDKYIDDMNQGTSADWGATLHGAFPIGKPYKRWQIPNRSSLLHILGRGTRKLIHVLFDRHN
ncbi:MAG: hypothetical protein KAV00_07295 [Phycisphaerae bacterium]|nr:hypothetical protein [Phycisphaerae bacterium]